MSFLFEKMSREQCEAVREADGFAAGFERGEAAGFERGETAGKRTIAANLKANGIDSKMISVSTGLTEEEIDKLQAGDMRLGDFRVTSYGHTEFVCQSCLPYSWRRVSVVLPAASAARLGRRIDGQALKCVGITGFAGNLRNRQIQTPIS